MKKIFFTIMLLTIILANTAVYAQNSINNINNNTNNSINNTSNSANTNSTEDSKKDQAEARVSGEIIELKDKAKKGLEEYQESYGSKTYGLVAYILNALRVYSIPVCFVGFAMSAVYQNVIGVHRLDMANKGYAMMISMLTLFVLAQLLPLIFAIVIKGFAGQAI